ncbi:cohesin domain-containing protein [Paenibacillus sp. LHD-117]|uniref:cohesin domain-containing protein n=1 Tax=Paenibacillus sp. LHD-117 TaxID=3071412 RepID=UPI0027E1ECEE|nr:cohesin domain-containing protein [Paenibacillus sp. LHD-117]MDQ6422143.1 cohesin domain-containing protein [Paenibacillus sp. LHD-117]
MDSGSRKLRNKPILFMLAVIMFLTSFGTVSAAEPPEAPVTNVASGKKITSSVAFSKMDVITDGVKNTSAYSEDYPNGNGLQWIQLDLGKSFNLSEINIWRYWNDGRTYRDLIVRLSDHSDFSGEVTTVFNNDTNNSAGFGIGADREYVETSAGKSIRFETAAARYVRIYSGGSTANANNHFVEVEVMGAAPPPTTIPAIPDGNAYPMGTSRINASWSLPDGAAGYDIEVDGVVVTDVTMPYGHKNLEEKSTHTYRVRAKNHLGVSDWSEPFNGTTLAPVTAGPRFMGPNPGPAQGTNPSVGVFELSNAILSASFQLEGNNLTLKDFRNKMTSDINPIQAGELFALELSGSTFLTDSNMTAGEAVLTRIDGDTNSEKVAGREDGWKVSVPFTYTSGGKTLMVNWSAALRDGSNYITQDVIYKAVAGSWNVTKVKLIDMTAAGVEKAGAVDGSPFFAGKVFFAQETPVAKVSVNGNKAIAYVDRGDATMEGQSFEQSTVIGLYPGNQKLRAFQYYLERERAQEHDSFLHYNSWYDLSWIFDTYMTEEDSLEIIKLWGEKFIEQRGAPLENFLFDDGYDDYSGAATTIWNFNPLTYPNGAANMKSAAEEYGASLGFWLSPTGGYYHKLPARVAIGKKMSEPTETKASGGEEIFKMSGPNYYKVFKDAVTKKQLEEGTKHFKFDRTEGIEDFHALLKLTGEMRENDPTVFINATVGTWASPYFTFYVDSIWRGGGDMGKAGSGTIRQQWINYRDKVSRDLLQRNPYYPLNSLMVHGIVHSRFGQGAWVSHESGTESGPLLDMTKEANLKDFSDEVWSYFASGYNLQELYIRPTSDYTTDQMWDILAEASAWAELNHDVLLDSHFIGGDPGQEAYGIASYALTKGVLMLRNPSSASQTINVDVNSAFMLPAGAKANYRLVNKLQEETDLHLKSGESHAITIPAHSILLYEAYPEGTEVIPGEGGIPSELSATLDGPNAVDAGETFRVTFGLNGVASKVLGQDITIEYDADVLEFVSAASLLNGVKLIEPIKHTPGKLQMILFSEGIRNAVSGNEQVLELTFTAKAAEQSVTGTVSVSKAILGDEHGAESEPSLSSLTIRINGASPGNPIDLNNDGKVTIGDLAIVAVHYGKNSTSPDWQQWKKADLSGDGEIGLEDLAAVASKILE